MKVPDLFQINDYLMKSVIGLFEYVYSHIRTVYTSIRRPCTFFELISNKTGQLPPALLFFLVNILIVNYLKEFSFDNIQETVSTIVTQKTEGQTKLVQYIFSCLEYLCGMAVFIIIFKIKMRKHQLSWASILETAFYLSAYFYVFIGLEFTFYIFSMLYVNDNSLLSLAKIVGSTAGDNPVISLNLEKFRNKEVYKIILGMDNFSSPSGSWTDLASLVIRCIYDWFLVPYIWIITVLWAFKKCFHNKRELILSGFVILGLFIVCQLGFQTFGFIQEKRHYGDVATKEETNAYIDSLINQPPPRYSIASMATHLLSQDTRLPSVVRYESAVKSTYYALCSSVTNLESISHITLNMKKERYDRVLEQIDDVLSDIEKREDYNYTKAISPIRFLSDYAKERRKEMKYYPSQANLSASFGKLPGDFSLRLVP